MEETSNKLSSATERKLPKRQSLLSASAADLNELAEEQEAAEQHQSSAKPHKAAFSERFAKRAKNLIMRILRFIHGGTEVFFRVVPVLRAINFIFLDAHAKPFTLILHKL